MVGTFFNCKVRCRSLCLAVCSLFFRNTSKISSSRCLLWINPYQVPTDQHHNKTKEFRWNLLYLTKEEDYLTGYEGQQRSFDLPFPFCTIPILPMQEIHLFTPNPFASTPCSMTWTTTQKQRKASQVSFHVSPSHSMPVYASQTRTPVLSKNHVKDG